MCMNRIYKFLFSRFLQLFNVVNILSLVTKNYSLLFKTNQTSEYVRGVWPVQGLYDESVPLGSVHFTVGVHVPVPGSTVPVQTTSSSRTIKKVKTYMKGPAKDFASITDSYTNCTHTVVSLPPPPQLLSGIVAGSTRKVIGISAR